MLTFFRPISLEFITRLPIRQVVQEHKIKTIDFEIQDYGIPGQDGDQDHIFWSRDHLPGTVEHDQLPLLPAITIGPTDAQDVVKGSTTGN